MAKAPITEYARIDSTGARYGDNERIRIVRNEDDQVIAKTDFMGNAEQMLAMFNATEAPAADTQQIRVAHDTGQINDHTEERGTVHYETPATITVRKRIGGRVYLRVFRVVSRRADDELLVDHLEVERIVDLPMRADWIHRPFGNPAEQRRRAAARAAIDPDDVRDGDGISPRMYREANEATAILDAENAAAAAHDLGLPEMSDEEIAHNEATEAADPNPGHEDYPGQHGPDGADEFGMEPLDNYVPVGGIMAERFVTKERAAHRHAVECRDAAIEAGLDYVAIVVVEAQGSWRFCAFTATDAAEGYALTHRKAGHYVNNYEAAEVDMFINEPNEFLLNEEATS